MSKATRKVGDGFVCRADYSFSIKVGVLAPYLRD
jgi:hypothetical protein